MFRIYTKQVKKVILLNKYKIERTVALSDGITDTRRDKVRQELLDKIYPLEVKLLSNDIFTRDIKNLLGLWMQYKDIKGGYWTISNTVLANSRIELYEGFLKTGKLELIIKGE